MSDLGTVLFLVIVWLVCYRGSTAEGIRQYRVRREFRKLVREYERIDH